MAHQIQIMELDPQGNELSENWLCQGSNLFIEDSPMILLTTRFLSVPENILLVYKPSKRNRFERRCINNFLQKRYQLVNGIRSHRTESIFADGQANVAFHFFGIDVPIKEDIKRYLKPAEGGNHLGQLNLGIYNACSNCKLIEITKWTSSNYEVNKIIQMTQLDKNANEWEIWSWIDYNRLKYIEYLTKGEGLCAIHNKGFSHHDIHSGNLMLTETYNNSKYILGDLGLCRLLNETSSSGSYGKIPFSNRAYEAELAADIFNENMGFLFYKSKMKFLRLVYRIGLVLAERVTLKISLCGKIVEEIGSEEARNLISISNHKFLRLVYRIGLVLAERVTLKISLCGKIVEEIELKLVVSETFLHRDGLWMTRMNIAKLEGLTENDIRSVINNEEESEIDIVNHCLLK
ncbi:hypothetical protein Glove_10g20 [Diversispora epigaea]|uniref:Protein kinase domain-containing protein n=1 Tax=Diversispora epigaea TaxID=1348612 RepID=A0A397JY38_9GLOM|nr:hypothetical protein Glove_10g20 [Diversispora epigaea]